PRRSGRSAPAPQRQTGYPPLPIRSLSSPSWNGPLSQFQILGQLPLLPDSAVRLTPCQMQDVGPAQLQHR
ncbi:DNA binding domain, excisionase family, partial [Dysosmobacter welbionis]